ncbi:hypothetical protein EDC01DRAFT_718542 [Geopyxis carbonaria]|nr:hypothetical protein EDC01DRAFT_718542 [Geopyxis carbonaria]
MNSYNDDNTGGEHHQSPQRRPKSVTFDKETPHVLEYEIVTPDPSVEGSPGQQYDDDEDDDYDLENTPVIEPDAWPTTSTQSTSQPELDDPFRSTPSPNSRPLPPIPHTPLNPEANSPGSRPLPTIPMLDHIVPSRMSIEDRMNMMGIQPSPEVEQKSMPTADNKASSDGLGIDVDSTKPEDKQKTQDESMSPVLLPDDELSDGNETLPITDVEPRVDRDNCSLHESLSQSDDVPQLSRESIRRQVEERRNNVLAETSDEVPMGNTYCQSKELHISGCEIPDIKHELTEDVHQLDIFSIPEFHNVPERPASRFGTRSPDSDQITESDRSSYKSNDDDEESRYSECDSRSQPHPEITSTIEHSDLLPESETHELSTVGLPDMSAVLDDGGIGLGLQEYMSTSPRTIIPEPDVNNDHISEAPSMNIARDFFARVSSPIEDCTTSEDDDTGSVIRHNIYHSGDDDQTSDDDQYLSHEDSEHDESNIPQERSLSPVEEALATIRAPGGTLKTRASATPSDMAAMAAARRHVSGEQNNYPPPVPRIPDGYRSEGEKESSGGSDTDSIGDHSGQSDSESVARRHADKKRRKSAVLPALGEFEFDLKLDELNDEFERVIEKQKRGYLMRQNTKIIHASNRDPDEERGSKPESTITGHTRGQSWSVEPWRSTNRRRSQRDGSIGTRKRPSNCGPVPPLPGRDGVTTKRLSSVGESEITGRPSIGSVDDHNVERGRLFVKVIGVKDLELPLPQAQPTYFCLTLDNGLHCVTTSWLELGKNAPIGQEFELVVLNDLEFQLTLQTKLEAPPALPQGVFFSQKKKTARIPISATNATTVAATTSVDLTSHCMGSAACLKDFESRAYGRPFTTDVHCFNEWAVDATSVKSKRGIHTGLQPARKAPYKIGKLEIQLFFVPKPKGSSDKDMPKSMGAAMRELREAEQIMNRTWEGNLSQQGGDCPFWRRRYFKLNGARLTAYHEATRQPRATINLSKAIKLIDDRNSLVDPNVPGPGKTRRKSGFSEEEEGYMFVEEGFRVRFGNGEVIDFYADSPEDKQGWMSILNETIGRVPDPRGWCQMVFAKEAKNKSEKDRVESAAGKLRTPQEQMRISQTFSRDVAIPNSGSRPNTFPSPHRKPPLNQPHH